MTKSQHWSSQLRNSSFWIWRAQNTAITREGASYLFVLAFVFTGAVLREINLMLVLAGMMVGPLVFNWRTARRMVRGVRIERILPRTVVAGLPATLQYRATSANRSCAISVADDVVHKRSAIASDNTAAVGPTRVASGSSSLATAWFGDVRAGRPIVVASQLVFPQRGVYKLGPIKMQTSFPLGLLRATRREPAAARLLVLPRLGRLTRRWRLLLDSSSHGESRQRRQGTVQGDFYGLRDWRSGDSRRHIHWRTSARRGTLMIRQFEQNRNQDLVLLVDLWQPAAPSEADRARVEQAVSFAATLANQTCRQGGSQLTVAYYAADGQPHAIQASASAALGRDLQVRFAEMSAHSSGTAAQLFAACPSVQRGVTMVLVSTRPSASRPSQQPGQAAPANTADRLPGGGQRDQRWLVVAAGSQEFEELIDFDR